MKIPITDSRPRVLGLTATIVNSGNKFENIEKMIKNMRVDVYYRCLLNNKPLFKGEAHVRQA